MFLACYVFREVKVGFKRTRATVFPVYPIAANQGTAQLPHPPFAMSPRSPLAIQQEDGMEKKAGKSTCFFWRCSVVGGCLLAVWLRLVG